jgi:hypothetical protein
MALADGLDSIWIVDEAAPGALALAEPLARR